MAWNVYPTQTPVGSWQGADCRKMREYQHAAHWDLLHRSPLHSFRCSGGAFTKATSTSVAIPAGTYVIDGYVAQNDAASELTIAAGTSNYIFARLLQTGTPPMEIVTGAEYYANDNGALPSEPHVLIGMIDSSDVVQLSPVYPRICSGSHTGNASAKYIFLGFEPAMVMVRTSDLGFGIGFPSGPGLRSAVPTDQDFWVVQPYTPNLLTISTFGFTIPAGLNSAGDTIYWTAWA